MEKVYLVSEEWIGDAVYGEEQFETTRDVAIVKDQQQAEEMCRRLREEKLAQLSADRPNDKYDPIDDVPFDSTCIAGLRVDARHDYESGTYFWWSEPFDLIGS